MSERQESTSLKVYRFTLLTFTGSKSTIETVEKDVKYVQS